MKTLHFELEAMLSCKAESSNVDLSIDSQGKKSLGLLDDIGISNFLW